MVLTVMVSIKFNMANPYQNTILLEQAFEEIKEICKKFQNDSGSSNSEFKTLLKEIASLWDAEEKTKFGFR